jgi:hypothetical protein
MDEYDDDDATLSLDVEYILNRHAMHISKLLKKLLRFKKYAQIPYDALYRDVMDILYSNDRFHEDENTHEWIYNSPMDDMEDGNSVYTYNNLHDDQIGNILHTKNNLTCKDIISGCSVNSNTRRVCSDEKRVLEWWESSFDVWHHGEMPTYKDFVERCAESQVNEISLFQYTIEEVGNQFVVISSPTPRVTNTEPRLANTPIMLPRTEPVHNGTFTTFVEANKFAQIRQKDHNDEMVKDLREAIFENKNTENFQALNGSRITMDVVERVLHTNLNADEMETIRDLGYRKLQILRHSYPSSIKNYAVIKQFILQYWLEAISMVIRNRDMTVDWEQYDIEERTEQMYQKFIVDDSWLHSHMFYHTYAFNTF